MPEIFRVGKHKQKAKFGNTKMRESPSNGAAKIQTFKPLKLDW